MNELFNNLKLINRLTYLIAGLAVIILLFSGIYYVATNCFLITHVTIVGDTNHITDEQLMEIARTRLHGTLFTLDINGLQQEFRQIPWVDRVTVARDFPHAIIVGISEHEVLAKLGDSLLITKGGKVFTGSDDSESLAVFYVPINDVPLAITRYNIIVPFIQIHNLAVENLTIITDKITKIILSNNLTIVLCGDDITDKLKQLNQYWDKLYAINPKLTYVNMCYSNAAAIK